MTNQLKLLFMLLFMIPMSGMAQNATLSPAATETVQEALDWISGKLPDIKMNKYFDGSLTRRGYTEIYTYTIEYDAANCTVILNQKYSWVKDDRSGRNDYDVETKYEFKLSDIKSIEIVENSPYYGVNSYVGKTNNSKDLIKQGENAMVNEFAIKYNELGELAENPERFLNAFNDAIKNCGGGKKEKY